MYSSVWFSFSAATYWRGQSLHQERQERRDLHGSGHHVSTISVLFFLQAFYKTMTNIPIMCSCMTVQCSDMPILCKDIPAGAVIYCIDIPAQYSDMPVYRPVHMPVEGWVLVVDHVLFCPHSYSSDCDLMVKLKGMNMGIKDLQVGVHQYPKWVFYTGVQSYRGNWPQNEDAICITVNVLHLAMYSFQHLWRSYPSAKSSTSLNVHLFR